MEKKDFIWKMGGQQGQGVESCGEILGRVLAQEGYSLFSQRLFASRIKGGAYDDCPSYCDEKSGNHW